MRHRADSTAWASPAAFLKGRDSESQFQLQGVFGMKIAAAVAAQDFQLTVNRFHGLSGGERTTNRLRVAEEGQIVRTFLAQLGDEAGRGLSEAVTEFFELLVSELQIPAGFNRPPTLLKFAGVGFGE